MDNKQVLTTEEDQCGDLCYFLMKRVEIPRPKRVTVPVKIRDGREIVAVSAAGSKRYVFTEQDIERLEMLGVMETPDWLTKLADNN